MTSDRAKPPSPSCRPRVEERDNRQRGPVTGGPKTLSSVARGPGADAASHAAQQAGAPDWFEADREEYLERALRHLRGGLSEQQLDEIRRQLRERWDTDPTLVALIERLRAARAAAGSRD